MPEHEKEVILRGVNHHVNTDRHAVPVEGEKDHEIGCFRNRGVAILEDGRKAALTISGTFDWHDDFGQMAGYTTYVFDDGSKLVFEFKGKIQSDGDGRVYEGKTVSGRGTGQFEGYTGTGWYHGRTPAEGLVTAEWETRLTKQ